MQELPPDREQHKKKKTAQSNNKERINNTANTK